MAVYSVFLALGLNISIRPVLELDEEELMGYYDDELEDKHFPENNFVASKLKPLVVSDVGGDGSDIVKTIESFGGEWLDVNWLNSAKHENIGFVHLKVCLHAKVLIFILSNTRNSTETKLKLHTRTPMRLSLSPCPQHTFVSI